MNIISLNKRLVGYNVSLNTNKDTFKQLYSNSNPSQENVIPYLLIPKLAFSGNFVTPLLSKNLNDNNKSNVMFEVFPQNKLVTPDKKLYLISGKVDSGPSNDKIIVLENKSGKVYPDKDGNFVGMKNVEDFNKVNAFYFANKTLQLSEEALGREIIWRDYLGNEPRLKIIADAGYEQDCYYNNAEGTLRFYHFNSRHNDEKVIYIAQMADLIAHETGHAILDSFRYKYFNATPESQGIHEGFGDICSILVALSDDYILDMFIQETDGDLRKHNIVPSFAEYFAKHSTMFDDKDKYVRTAINDMKFSDFDLRENVHKIGCLFSGTFYDLLEAITKEVSKTKDFKESLIEAREISKRLLLRALADFSPFEKPHFVDIAKAFIKADKIDFDSKYSNLIEKVFIERELITVEQIKDWEQEEKLLLKYSIPLNDMASDNSFICYLNSHKSEVALKDEKEGDYIVEKSYKTDKGESFYSLRAPISEKTQEEIDYEDSLCSDWSLNIYSILLIGFDKNGQLIFKDQNRIKEVDTNM